MSRAILVVDDDGAIVRLYATALSQLGQVTAVNGGQEAIEALRTTRFDAAVIDLYMPGVGGLDVLDSLPGTINHDTPVFVVTADQSESTRALAMRRGAIYQLTKPVPLRILIDSVRTQLDRKNRSSKLPP
ncbi:MAG: response regulator [Polyangiaceae bacterium]